MTMHLFATRRPTFNKTRKGANKVLNWPHVVRAPSSIHPDKLALAGFHHSPTPVLPARTLCFLCDVEISDWAEGDDAFERHLAASPTCGHALCASNASVDWLHNKKAWDSLWGDKGERWPKGELMLQAREHTFSVGWPHHGEKGVPTVKELAAAGWYFNPASDEDSLDQCSCPYCPRAASLWEAGDNALAMHKKKEGVKCPFFIAPKPDIASNADEESEEVDDGGIRLVEDSPALIRKATSTGKGKKALSRSGNSRTTITVDSDEEEVARPATRTRRAGTVASSDTESVAAPVAKKSGSGRQTRTSKKPSAASEILFSPAASVKSTLSRSNGSRLLSIISDDDDDTVAKPPPQSRSKPKVATLISEETEEAFTEVGPQAGPSEEPVVISAPEKEKKQKNSTASSRASKVPSIAEEPTPAPAPTKNGKGKKVSPKALVESEHESELEELREVVEQPDAEMDDEEVEVEVDDVEVEVDDALSEPEPKLPVQAEPVPEATKPKRGTKSSTARPKVVVSRDAAQPEAAPDPMDEEEERPLVQAKEAQPIVEQPHEVEPKRSKTKSKTKSKSKSKAKKGSAAPATPAAGIDVFSDEQPPATPNRSQASLDTSTKIKAGVSPRVPLSNVFYNLTRAFTEEEMEMTVEQAFDHSSRRLEEQLSQELKKGHEELAARFEAGAKHLQALIEEKEREMAELERDRPRQRM